MLVIEIGNPGRVLKKRVSGFDFKKPGYSGQVSLEIAKLAIFGPQNGDYGFFREFWLIIVKTPSVS